MIASLDQIEIDECQALCRDTYSTNCQLFSYDMRMKKCVLWKERDLVLGRCTVKSGPSDTTHADICLTDVDNWTEKSCHVKLYPVMIYDTEKYRSCNIIFVLQVLRFTSVQFYIVFQAFRLGYCHNAGDLISHLGNISDELSCQRACSTVHNIVTSTAMTMWPMTAPFCQTHLWARTTIATSFMAFPHLWSTNEVFFIYSLKKIGKMTKLSQRTDL